MQMSQSTAYDTKALITRSSRGSRPQRLDLELFPEVGEAVGDGVLLLDLPEVEPDLEPRSRRLDLELLPDVGEEVGDGVLLLDLLEEEPMLMSNTKTG